MPPRRQPKRHPARLDIDNMNNGLTNARRPQTWCSPALSAELSPQPRPSAVREIWGWGVMNELRNAIEYALQAVWDVAI